jgi:two-component system sensor histidine kinase AtoS
MNRDTAMPDLSNGSEPVDLVNSLLDGAAFGTIVVSPAGDILALDGVAERLVRLSRAEVLGFPASRLPAALASLIDETLATSQPLNNSSVQLSAPTGEMKSLAVSTHLARRPDGGLLSMIVELRDTGQLQEIAANLEHLDRLANVGILTAGVAHEIKNALVAIRTFVDLLQEQNKDDDLAQLVSKEMARIDATVRQVLRDATREEFTLAPLGVHGLLQESVNLLRQQFAAHSIKYTLRLDAPSDLISGDERQIRHALLNLLMNSMEAIRGSGRIEVSSSLSAVNGRRELCVRISDTGCGIRPDLLPRLFSPFFTTKKDGTGLGLAIAHRIIKQHDGIITVESKVNEGTTFQVLLPLL